MAANTFCGFRSFFCLLIFAISTVKTFAQLCNQYTFLFHYFLLLLFSSTFNTFSIRHFHRTLLFQSDMCFTSSDGFATGSSTPHSNRSFCKVVLGKSRKPYKCPETELIFFVVCGTGYKTADLYASLQGKSFGHYTKLGGSTDGCETLCDCACAMNVAGKVNRVIFSMWPQCRLRL